MNVLLRYFPLMWVDLATLCTVFPLSFVFYFQPLNSKMMNRWEVPIVGLSLSQQDYHAEMFKTELHTVCFIVWTIQSLINVIIMVYHFRMPHHAKFYSTIKNRVCMLMHITGGFVAVFGFYLGAVLNMKLICCVAAISGLSIHLPTVIWFNRQTHGQREMSHPAYTLCWVLLLISYANFALYDASYDTVFSCGMTLNLFSMVRFWGYATVLAKIEASYDRTLFFALFTNLPFIQGSFCPMFFLFALHLWNWYFSLIKPCPRFMMRVERGYSDTIPLSLETKRGTTFREELERQTILGLDKKEAIARAMWNILVGDERNMDNAVVVELYRAWGMPDAEDAAKETFRRVDLDKSGFVDYDEFKIGFNVLIDGIHLKGEYDDTFYERQHLEEKEKKEKTYQ